MTIGENCMIEQTLAEFKENFGKATYPADLKTAGDLFIPNHWLFRAKLSDDEKNAVISSGRDALNTLPSWLFIRTSWSQYFFLSKESSEEVTRIVNNRISELVLEVPAARWWRLFITPLDMDIPLDYRDINRIDSELANRESPLNFEQAPEIGLAS